SFDLLCAVLFAVLCVGTIFAHRDPGLVWYWIVFSCVGIVVELALIIYAFLSTGTYQEGLVNNSFILCLGLVVETIFAFIIYQFYLAVYNCNPCVQRKLRPQPSPCQSC
ncbi:hypothetical protein KR222_001219, partial [Zaprionus bogoriensis]